MPIQTNVRFRPFAQRARARELDRLIATQIAIGTTAFDLESVMATVVREARQLTGADAAVVELPDGEDMVYRAAAGTAVLQRGLRLRRDASASGLALATGQVISCPDTRLDPRVDRDACERVGARSMLVVPLMHDEVAAGVLKVYADRPRAFLPRHEPILAGLAQLVGTALVRAELMTKLEEQAVRDELTGLRNRRAWYERLDEAMARARRSGAPLTVIVLDLDGFKQVNDRKGHAAGDRVLCEVAKRWSSALREVDTLGRLGGDEFAAIAEGANEQAAASVVDRLVAASADVQAASAGFAVWDGLEGPDMLVARADTRMYEAKRQHKTAA